MILLALFFQNNLSAVPTGQAGTELGEKGILGQPPSQTIRSQKFLQQTIWNVTSSRWAEFSMQKTSLKNSILSKNIMMSGGLLIRFSENGCQSFSRNRLIDISSKQFLNWQKKKSIDIELIILYLL